MEITVDDPSKKSVNQKIAVKGKDRTAQIADAGNTYSAKDFTTQLERIDKEMIKFWEKDDKVGAIRIAIQCCKLLNDVATPIFYPQKFILLTDILDTFSNLIH